LSLVAYINAASYYFSNYKVKPFKMILLSLEKELRFDEPPDDLYLL
jgi:hypothetical protein